MHKSFTGLSHTQDDYLENSQRHFLSLRGTRLEDSGLHEAGTAEGCAAEAE